MLPLVDDGNIKQLIKLYGTENLCNATQQYTRQLVDADTIHNTLLTVRYFQRTMRTRLTQLQHDLLIRRTRQLSSAHPRSIREHHVTLLFFINRSNYIHVNIPPLIRSYIIRRKHGVAKYPAEVPAQVSNQQPKLWQTARRQDYCVLYLQ